MIKFIVTIEFGLLKAFYFMTVWNWFINNQIYQHQMNYVEALSIIIVYAGLTISFSKNETRLEFDSWLEILTPVLYFGSAILISWIIKLIIL